MLAQISKSGILPCIGTQFVGLVVTIWGEGGDCPPNKKIYWGKSIFLPLQDFTMVWTNDDKKHQILQTCM